MLNQIGQYVYNKALGYVSTEPEAPHIHFDNVMIIASCTKLITSIAALQCVGRGLLTLDESLTKHLPELNDLKVLEINEDSTKVQEPFRYKDISSTPTLRQLLTHTSGLGYDMLPPLSIWRKWHKQGSQTVSPHHDVITSFSTPYLYNPGDGWAYGCGIDWAGLLIRRLTNSSLEEYMTANIFKPLGMHSTTFYLDSKPDLRSRLVPIMKRKGDASFTRLHPKGPPGPPRDEKGGGGLYSTPNDYLAVLRDIISDEPKLLSSEMADILFTPQIALHSSSMKALWDTFPLFSPMVGGIEFNQGINHALGGLLIGEDVNVGGFDGQLGGVMKAGTMTWGGAGNLVWFANRKHGVAGFYASQVFPPGDSHSSNLIRASWEEAWRLFAEKEVT